MTSPYPPALNAGEAHRWSRRLRKLGFSPVTRHPALDGPGGNPVGGYWLRCNWPYPVEALPLDLLPYFFADEQDGLDGEWNPVHWVQQRHHAAWLLARFRVIRLGMGSRPIPAVGADREPPFTTAGRVVADADDWSSETWRHPDYTP